MQHANNYASDRCALIGDAAHRLHPLAGQGLNAGITDVAYLVNTLVEAKRSGQDIGSYELTLKDYERLSKINAYALSGAVEFIKSSYDDKFVGSEMLG